MKELSRFRQFLAEGVIKEDITKLRGQELLDFFSFTKYMNVDQEELRKLNLKMLLTMDSMTDPGNVEQDKKDFTEENGDGIFRSPNDRSN